MVEKTNYEILQTISFILGILTITICFVLKIPQIINLVNLKKSKGISLIGLLMELFSYTIMLSYSYQYELALISYMEYPIILIQQIILIFLVLYYNNALNLMCLVGTCTYFSLAGGFLSGKIPKEILLYLLPLRTPIGASAKIVQLIKICQSKNSESVSLLTWFISTCTNTMRFFTVLIDTGNKTLLLNFFVNAILSLSIILVAQQYKPKQGQKTE